MPTDTELQRALLQWFYDRRSEVSRVPRPEELSVEITPAGIARISQQLDDKGLINGTLLGGRDGSEFHNGRITGRGIRAIEEGDGLNQPSESGTNQTINVQSPTGNLQIGDHNVQQIEFQHMVLVLEAMAQRIEESDGTEEEKEDAKSRLRRFLEHPLVKPMYAEGVGKLLEDGTLTTLLG